MEKVGVVLWTRMPLPGSRAKTRIAAAIGDQDLANRLSLMLAQVTISNITAPNVDIFIYHPPVSSRDFEGSDYFGDSIKEYFAYNTRVGWLENTWLSLRKLLVRGYRKAVALVSDCPYFLYSHLQSISEYLDQKDIVLVPAIDKGINAYGVVSSISSNTFYADNIVSRSPHYDLVSEVTQHLSRENYSFAVIYPPLPDIDELQDVQEYWNALTQGIFADRVESVKALREIYSFLLAHCTEFKLEGCAP
jgi:glycosyltransferase A (GT-A) superfamily protein (DUF2064 family)